MKLSNRDKKIMLIVVIALIVALPYLFVIKPTNEKKTGVEGEIATLQTRYDELKVLNDQRKTFEDGIVNMNKEMDEVMLGYAEDIKKENTIMFLRGIELNTPLFMKTVTFSGTVVTPLNPGTVDAEGNVVGASDGLRAPVAVSYVGSYDAVKQVLAYIAGLDDRMVISSIDITYDGNTATHTGVFVLEQYAITGDGRELEDAQIPAMPHGNESIFGTYISDPALLEEMQEAAEELAEEE